MKLTPKQKRFVDECLDDLDEDIALTNGYYANRTARNIAMIKLHALNKLSMHIGLIAPCAALKPSKEELNRRLEKYGLGLVAVCLIVIGSNAHPISKAACGRILEFFLPDWRSKADKSLVGNVVERNDTEVVQWKKIVLERDNHQCTRCEGKNDLHVHHIVSWADAPELRIIPENGIVLCKRCHNKEHSR